MSCYDDPPIPRQVLNELFEYLSSRRTACNHKHSATKTFLRQRKLPVEATIEWLQLHGAYCDCEVSLNIGTEWDD